MNFKEYIRNFSSTWKWAAAAATSAPFALFPVDIYPPWPHLETSGIAALSSIFAIFGVFLPFMLLANKQKFKIFGIVSIFAGLTILLGYLSMHSLYVGEFSRQINGKTITHQYVKGRDLKPGIVESGYSEERIFELNGFQPEHIYTADSLLVNRMGLFSSFVLAFFFLNMGIGFSASGTKRDESE